MAMFVHLSLFESQPYQQRKAIKRRDKDGETLRSIGRSYNVKPAKDFEADDMTENAP